MALGICSNSTIIAPFGMKKAHRKLPKTYKGVTVFESISMNERKIRSIVKSRDVDFHSSWLEEKISGFIYNIF